MRMQPSALVRLINTHEANVLYTALDTKSLVIVGGAVRDTLSGVTAKDIDFASELTPADVMEKLIKSGIHFVETGIRRGTITALIPDRNDPNKRTPVEITTFRNPENEKEFSKDIKIDLSARDFTINAIAVNVRTGEIIDPYNGVKDIEHKIIRTVGYPGKRFIEDPHRILRMIRFAYKHYNWNINIETLTAAEKHAHLLQNVSAERIRDELVKILKLDFPSSALRTMTNFGIMQYVIPELVVCRGFGQNHYHTLDVFEHILCVVNGTENKIKNRLAALFHDIGKPDSMTIDEQGIKHFIGHEDIGAEMTEKIMHRLKFSNDEMKDVKKLVALHMRPVNMGSKGVRKLLMQIGDLLPEWLDLKEADFNGGHTQDVKEFESMLAKLKETIEYEQNRVDVPKFMNLSVNGNDMLDLGMKGPVIGQALNHLQEMVIEDPAINIRENMLELAKSFRDTFGGNNG